MTVSIDTNIVLRVVLSDVPHLTDIANIFIDNADTSSIVIEDQVFVELEYALCNHYHYSRTEVVEVIEVLVSQPQFITNTLVLKEIIKPYGIHPKLSFTDCLLSVCATNRSATPLYTFDKKLANQLENAKLLE